MKEILLTKEKCIFLFMNFYLVNHFQCDIIDNTEIGFFKCMVSGTHGHLGKLVPLLVTAEV